MNFAVEGTGEIEALLKGNPKESNILVDEFHIVNVEFSKNVNDAIEAKVTAEQQALLQRTSSNIGRAFYALFSPGPLFSTSTPWL